MLEIVVLDACVLYPASMRDFLLRLARQDAFRPRWSGQIVEEFVRNILKNIPELQRSSLERTVAMMNDAFAESAVSGFEHLEKTLDLPDAADRHVLAAAIAAKATTIVTMNLRDFPVAELAKHRVVALHPDAFAVKLMTTAPGMVERAFTAQQQSLKNPPVAVADLLATLEKQGLVDTVRLLRVRLGAM